MEDTGNFPVLCEDNHFCNDDHSGTRTSSLLIYLSLSAALRKYMLWCLVHSCDRYINSQSRGKSLQKDCSVCVLNCMIMHILTHVNTLHCFCDHNQAVYAKQTPISHLGTGAELPSQNQISQVLRRVARFPKGCSSNSWHLKTTLYMCLLLPFVHCCLYMCLCTQSVSCVRKHCERDHVHYVSTYIQVQWKSFFSLIWKSRCH